MSYIIDLENVVNFPVKFKFKQSDRTRNFEFKITAERVDQERITAELGKDGPIADFLKNVVTNWSGQRLVLNPDRTPAEFSQDAFDAMLNVPGAALAIWADYTKAIAPGKN